MEFAATKEEMRFMTELYRSNHTPIRFNTVPDCAIRLDNAGLISATVTPDTAFSTVAPNYYVSLSDSGMSYYLHFVKSRRRKKIEWIRYLITTAIAVTALVVSIVSLLLQQSE